MNEKLRVAVAQARQNEKDMVKSIVNHVRPVLEQRGWKVQIRSSGRSLLCKRPDGARLSVVLRSGFSVDALTNGLLNVCVPEPGNPVTEALKDWTREPAPEIAEDVERLTPYADGDPDWFDGLERNAAALKAVLKNRQAYQDKVHFLESQMVKIRDILRERCVPGVAGGLRALAERVSDLVELQNARLLKLADEFQFMLGQANAPSLIEQRDTAVAEAADAERTLKLMEDANQRGVKMWQAATGKDMMWPDQAKLVAWLLERIDIATKAVKAWLELDEVAKNEEFVGQDLVLMLVAEVERSMAQAAQALGLARSESQQLALPGMEKVDREGKELA